MTLTLITLSSALSSGTQQTKAEKAGWQLSMRSYTLHRFTAVEAVEKTQKIDPAFIDIYHRQVMGEEYGNVVFRYVMTVDDQEILKEMGTAKGIKIISSGVWTAKREEWEKIFRFVKSMGLEFISAETTMKNRDLVEELSSQHTIKNRSDLLGSSADIGHYKRMGLNPLKCIKQLEGKIISFHFKDITPQGSEGTPEDVVLDMGVLHIDQILKELKSQKFEGYFTIEYEANWDNNLPKIRESVDYFKKSGRRDNVSLLFNQI